MYKTTLIIFILCTLYVIISRFKQKTHDFWDKQPVSRKTTKREGIISKNPRFNIILEDKMRFTDINITTNIELVGEFINKHFSETYIYSLQFLKNSLQYLKGSKVFNIGLYIEKKLIGFIHAKPVCIYKQHSKEIFYYVDFLCVHRNFRNRNIAVLLISALINKLGRKQKFIFKKETKPLPYNYINKTSYYFLNIGGILSTKTVSNKIVELDNMNIQTVYDFIVKVKQKTTFYDILSLDEFKQLYFGQQFKKLLVEFDNENNIVSVLTYIYVDLSQKNSLLHTIDIEAVYIDNIGNNIEIFDYIINSAKNNNISIISCVNQQYNKYFIDKYKMGKSMDLYFHAYNHHINSKIDDFNMGFNIL